MDFFNIDKRILRLADSAMNDVGESFAETDKITEYNQQKVLAAFIGNRVSESSFGGSTGYGYGDRGREALEAAFASSVGAQSALVRHSLLSGTHTITVALFGLLRPGDTMLCVTGKPYDTLCPVIGISGEGSGTLTDFGIRYKQVELNDVGLPDLEAIEKALVCRPKIVYIQRSRGYSLRPSLSVNQIGETARLVKSRSDALVVVDNCYGEFTEREEPLAAGADLIMGSLIKNAGGGIAKNGGYIAGASDLVELCAQRMTAPGIGGEIGATLGQTREMFLGLFNAPHVTGEALKTAAFASALFTRLGYEVTPRPGEIRHDIIQCIKLRTPEALIAFCQGIQKGSPVDSFAAPEPWDMPGYDCKIIMAAGAFTLGSSIELSADAPLREPYAVWMQGALNFHSGKAGVLLAAQEMLERGILKFEK